MYRELNAYDSIESRKVSTCHTIYAIKAYHYSYRYRTIESD